jgi:hypothetical protein
MRKAVCACAMMVLLPNVLIAQQPLSLNGSIWTREGASLPDVTVRVTPSIFLNRAAKQNERWEVRTSASDNSFSVPLTQPPAPPIVDLQLIRDGFRPVIVTGISTAPANDNRLHLRMLSARDQINAPECLAFSAQYDLSFRKEQQLSLKAPRSEIQRRVRTMYGEEILLLPNPSRYDQMPGGTKAMLDAMDREQNEELQNMLNGLFKLYGLRQMSDFSPSRWRTTYVDENGRRIEGVDVRLNGRRGTWGSQGVMEDIDMAYDDETNRFVIEGTVYVITVQGQKRKAYFIWRGDENDYGKFTGEWGFDRQSGKRGTWDGELVSDANSGNN